MHRSKIHQLVLSIAVLLGLLTLLATGCRKEPEAAPGTGQGSTASSSEDANGHAEWITDFEKAKQLAKTEGKDLLVDFSGSDWCGWCIKLDKEVFSKQEFIDEAQKNFIFVMIDFPNNKSGMSQALQDQNDRLAKQFEIKGFPTVLLMDADGVPYAQTGYQDGGPTAYLQHLKDLRSQK